MMKSKICFFSGLLLVAFFSFGNFASAETAITALGGGRVNELAHKLEIQMTGEVLDVVETITLSNAGRGDVEAIYRFDLPAQAAISELSVRDFSGNRTSLALVDTKASTDLISGKDILAKPDTGLLRMISSEGHGRDDTSRYELRVFPVPAKRSSVVTLRWQTPVYLVSGSHSVTLPNRGNDPLLSRSEVILTVPKMMKEVYSAGAKLDDGRSVGKQVSYRYFAPAGPLVIQARSEHHGLAHASVALYPLTATTGIAALRVMVPDGAQSFTPNFERVLVVLDTSKSMGFAGLKAASELLDGVLITLGAKVDVEVISYHRDAKRLFHKWLKSDRVTRSWISQALPKIKLENGSNLTKALLLGQASLGAALGKKDRTLVLIVTDSMMPTTNTFADLEVSLGLSHLKESRVVAAVLVPPHAPLPDLVDSPLRELAEKGRGRVAAIRYADASGRGQSLLAELTQPAPLHAIEVEFDQGVFVGDHLSGSVSSGQSVAAFGYYKGGTPKRVWVKGTRSRKRVRIAAKSLSGSISKQLASISLATTAADAFPGQKTRTEFLRAAKKLSVVTQVSALIALDKKDGFAKDRLALANKWGTQFYRRMPTPAERRDPKFQQFSYVSRDARKAKTRDGRSGELPKSLVSRLIRAHVIPPVRNCYESRLGRQPNLRGSLSMHIEVARGEVQEVKLVGLPHSLRPLKKCILDAAYALPFPKPRLGTKADLIYIVNYPLRFRRVKHKGNVDRDKVDVNSDTSDPLYGLPE